MCALVELELCCVAQKTNIDPHTIKIYKLTSHCAAFLAARQNRNYPNPNPNPPTPPPQQQQKQILSCPNFNPQTPRRLERIFYTTCAECIRGRYRADNPIPPTTSAKYRDPSWDRYGWDLRHHALQLAERLRRAQFELAMRSTPWVSFVWSVAPGAPAGVEKAFGIRERWVLMPGEMRWVSFPTRPEEHGGSGGSQGKNGNGNGDGKGDPDADWQRWWGGSFGKTMWEVCDRFADEAFPHGIWGKCELEEYDMNRAEFHELVLTPVTMRDIGSTISTPTTPGGTKYPSMYGQAPVS